MHEFSIAMNIVDIAVKTAEREKARKINSIILELGALSGVVKEALLFCFDAAAKGTLAEGAQLELEETFATASCDNCQFSFNTDQMVSSCPECGQTVFAGQGGRELSVKSINIDD